MSARIYKSKGFTLVELLVVISIIAILSVIGLTIFSGVQKGARDAKRKEDLHSLALALEQYKVQNNTYTLAMNFPCAGGGWWGFIGDWGVEGSITGNNTDTTVSCQSSVKNALVSYFSGPIPNDPLCSHNSCSNSWSEYRLAVGAGGQSFTLFARLENPPANPCTSTAPGSNNTFYNYCRSNQQ